MIWLLLGMLVLLISGMPIVLAIGLVSVVYAYYVAGVPLTIVPQQILSAVDTFLLLAIPMFILAGTLMGACGVTERLMRFSQSLVGWIRGGLAQVNILTSVFMAGISGSALADTAAVGSALVPVMKRSGYGAGFSAAVTACSACIGPIIPPSIIMVVIGGLTGISIGRMFLGGVIPGLTLALLFGIVAYVVSHRRDYPVEATFQPRELLRSFGSALPSLGLPAIIIGGILSGAFTPTEAAAVAVVYVIALGLLYRRLTWRAFYSAVLETGVVTGAVMLVVGVSAIFGWILIMEDTGSLVVAGLNAITSDPRVMMLLIVAVLLLLGMVVEVLAVLIISVPILVPLVVSVGIDPVHFGVVATIALATGLVTPPFGLSMFMICKLAKIPIEVFSREAIPFLLCLVGVIVLLVFVPGLVLWLPDTVMGVR